MTANTTRRMSQPWRAVWTIFLTALLPFTGYAIFVFVILGMTGFGACYDERPGCEWWASHLAGWSMLIGVVGGFLVALIAPWIKRGRPYPLWALFGLFLQILGLLISLSVLERI